MRRRASITDENERTVTVNNRRHRGDRRPHLIIPQQRRSASADIKRLTDLTLCRPGN